MEQGSDRHDPRLDEDMQHEVDAVVTGSTATDKPPVAHTCERFDLRFDPRYRLPAALFGVTGYSAWVEIDRTTGELRARFGPWLVETPLDNVADTQVTGPYSLIKTVGPPHLSLADRGLTFATAPDRGVCICFRRPVRGLDPLGVLRHPGLTVTVNDPEGLVRALREPAH